MDHRQEESDEAGGGREQHPVAGLDGLEAQPYGQVGFADPGRAEEDDVLAMFDEVAAAEHLELLLVQRGLIAEVEGLETLHEGEARQVGPHRDVLGGLRGDLFGEERVEEVSVGDILGGGVLQQRFEPLPALEEPEALQLLVEALELARTHADTAAVLSVS